jgi:ketosteroid isomerase-like protein
LAGEEALDRARITAMLDTYRKAIERRDVDGVGALYAAFSESQRAAVERFFAGARDIRVTIENVDAAVVGDEAIVSFTRTDDFVDTATGRPQRVTVRLSKTLRRVEGAWRFAPGKG